MKKSKKNKTYDARFQPRKNLYRTRKLFFVISIVTLILNMFLVAMFDDSMTKKCLTAIFWVLLFAVLQLIDKRKTQWEWLYIIVLSVLCLLGSAFVVFSIDLIFMRYIWAGEVVFFLGYILLVLHKEKQ